MPPRPKNKKSLAEELAELANPAPQTDIDPDADIFQSGPILEDSDAELMDAVHQSNMRPATRSFRRAAAAAADIILEGPDYAGKKSSSKAIFGDEDSEEEEDEEEVIESDSEDELHQNGTNGLHKQTANSSSDDDDDDDGQEEDDEMARLEREYREMQAAEISTVKQLQDRVSKERHKAIAVSNQTNLWKKALEARILLQKALAGGNRLPRGNAYTTAVEYSEKAGDALKRLASEASETLSSVCDVLEALMQRNPAVTGAQAAAGVQGGGEGGNKRKRDDNADGNEDEDDEDDASDKGWKRLEGCYKDLQPFRDSSIDRWHRKTVLQTGTAAVRGNLRILNQSVSTQIATVMADPTRLIQRTRVVKGSVKILCEPATAMDNKDVVEANKDSEVAIAGDEGDPETFDDTEFYQTLLKEFLDNSQAINNSMPTGRKQRKHVDRRASKGRKIRYHVHEKLVNFMTPVELKSPLYTSNLFANLFGGK